MFLWFYQRENDERLSNIIQSLTRRCASRALIAYSIFKFVFAEDGRALIPYKYFKLVFAEDGRALIPYKYFKLVFAEDGRALIAYSILN